MPSESDRQQIADIVGELRSVAEKTVRDIVRNVARELDQHTPKDTGRAAANWIPSIGRPAVTPRGGFPLAKARERQGAGLASLAGYRLGQGNAHVTNNVAYIEALNDGHSQQEPAGFVQRAIARAVAKARATGSILSR